MKQLFFLLFLLFLSILPFQMDYHKNQQNKQPNIRFTHKMDLVKQPFVLASQSWPTSNGMCWRDNKRETITRSSRLWQDWPKQKMATLRPMSLQASKWMAQNMDWGRCRFSNRQISNQQHLALSQIAELSNSFRGLKIRKKVSIHHNREFQGRCKRS